MFIDGELARAVSDATLENVNPVTEKVIGHTADHRELEIPQRHRSPSPAPLFD